MAHLDLIPKENISSCRKLAIGSWKTAYDACEAATVLFLRKFGLRPITGFRNRLLAFTIDLQNILFTEQLLSARIEGAVASDTYDVELETLRAKSFVVMLDDDEIERRVRLIQPMEQHKLSLTIMAESRPRRERSLENALNPSPPTSAPSPPADIKMPFAVEPTS